MVRLYDELARFWPVLSPPEDYCAEAAAIRALLDEHLPAVRDRRPRLLELGAGGGHTLVHLRDAFDLVAADLSDAMLANARALVPGLRCVVDDMRTMRLGETFDAVLAHDAIDYMLTDADLAAACATAAAHLDRGGVFIVAPTYVRETFTDDDYAEDARCHDKIEARYVSHVRRPDEQATTFELTMVMTIREANALTIVDDRHQCGLFTIDTWRAVLGGAGFDVRAVDDDATDRPHVLFVGVRR